MSDAYSALAGGGGGDLGGSDLGSSSGFPLSSGAVGGALALGGLGYMLSQGPAQLPGQYLAAQQSVPVLQGQSALTFGQGQALQSQAQQAYGMAQRGELTAPQAAQVAQDRQKLENQAAQTYASMGRSGPDTSKISTQANIDQQIAVESNAFIQSTIALATSQMGAGSSLMGLSLNEQSAANNVLLAAGQAQVQLDTNYSNSIASAFKAIGSIFGTAGKTAMMV